jgi:outer membrane protein assembly factor BamB
MEPSTVLAWINAHMKIPEVPARHLLLCTAGALLMTGVAHAQGAPRGFWTSPDANAAHSNWQKAENQISADTVTKDFKFLWKLKLGSAASKAPSFSEPLLYPGMITGKGFKDFALYADAGTLYGVDSELGQLVWQKDFTSRGTCGNLQVVTEAPQVIHFGAPRPVAKPGQPAPPPPPRRPPEAPMPASERRVGVSPGGGYFGLKGVYVVTGDGYLHEQIMSTGLDFAPPVKFLSDAGGSSFGLNMNDKVVYAMSGGGCHNEPTTLSAIDLTAPDYAVGSLKTEKAGLAGFTGPAIGREGTAYVVTGQGRVMALDGKDLKEKDWYAPTASGKELNAGAVVVAYKEKELIAAPGKDGSLVLLDAASLGGQDHHTPLAQTASLSKGGKRGAWEAMATAQSNGSTWVFASIAGPVEAGATFASSNGDAPHGSIVAFKVEDQDGHTQLTPAWKSGDLENPAPPVFANGLVYALAGGSSSKHATLYVLDAATGKQLYTSGDAIQSYTRLAGMSVGDGHVFFITHDNTLYSFGIPLEH